MRKLRLLATLVPLVALALPAAAQLDKFKDWESSPEFVYYATDDEKKAWEGVTSDEQAQKFFNLFWGKRHPDYQKTAQNVFRTRFDALVAEADKRFTLGKKRGALTERGKVLILLGPPKAIASKLESAGAGAAGGEGEEGSFLQTGGNVVVIQFQYDKEQLPEWAGMKSFRVNFTVDERAERESVDKTSDIKKLWKKAIAAAIVNPKMTEPPVYKTREEYEAEMKAAAEAAAEAAKGPVLSEPVRASLEALLGKEPQGSLTLFPLAYGDKATRLMVQLYVPASAVPAGAAGAAPEGMKIALLVRGKDGKDAARREEPAVLEKVREDWFVDVALPVDAGEYQVAALLLDASGAEKVSAFRPVTVTPLPSELAISPLLLACTDIAADGAKAEEPFVFSVRKFVARGGDTLEKTDGLAYVARVYNPAVDPATKKLHLKRSISIKPKNGSTIDVPQPPDEPMTVPEQAGSATALVIDLAGSIVDVNLGDYFRPGEYVMSLKITDVISGKSVEAKAPFSLAAPPAPAKAPAAAKPAAPKAPAPKK
ncbi:MAG TPA: GWxTD domain-containing protein [Thermoanaerobaculia bacterium]|nr:GWxTD domain-containing protein [Thermoanaerobaculia bacterium]